MKKLLARQLKKLDLSAEQIPKDVQAWQRFLQVIENTYAQHEKDRYLTERSFEISSQEINAQILKNKEMSSHLAQSSKLAAIGTLASGVAHELNNPLAAVRGYVELMLKSCGTEQSEFRDTLTRVIALTERMAKISSQLLKLSHKSNESDIGFCNLRDSITDIVDISSKEFELNRIQIKLLFNSKDLVVCGDLTRMAGVFQNLLTNSRDAFAANRSETRSSFIEISVADAEEPGFLDIIFKDNAGGIPSHVLPRIFDPFFTTKGVGGGTGLGLSLIRNSLEEVGSSISVVVEAPCTIFKIKLMKSDQVIKNENLIKLPTQVKPASTATRPKTLFISADTSFNFADEFKSYLDVTSIGFESEKLEKLNPDESFEFLILDGVENYDSIRAAVKNFISVRPETRLVLLGASRPDFSAANVLPEFSYLQIEKPIASRADFLFQLNDINPGYSSAA